ncbi:MAG: metal-dependent transcriptional regulator [Firmicutes bacterium]|nr:metal-dependent transcriptional regulator [Bacillota bacterium]
MKSIQKSGEDYLEVIYGLLQKSDHAHLTCIAKAMGVTKPSTSRALHILAQKGYIQKESYGTVTLTAQGTQHAEAVIKKHKAIRTLLTDVLGVSPKAAEADACKIEHCIGEETTEKLFNFLKL